MTKSASRKKAKRLTRNKELTNSKRTVWDWNPIKDWTEKQVLDYLKSRNIPLHPVYQYLKRFSCRVCIYMSPADVQKVALHDPDAIEIISEMENSIGFTMFQPGSIRDII